MLKINLGQSIFDPKKNLVPKCLVKKCDTTNFLDPKKKFVQKILIQKILGQES